MFRSRIWREPRHRGSSRSRGSEACSRRRPLIDRTYLQLSEDLGLPFDLVTRLFELWGIATPPGDARVREDDARILAHVARAYAAFGGRGALIETATRYFGDNIRRIAESQIGFFQREIIEPLFASGASLRDVVETVNPLIADVVRPAVADLLVWLHRRHVDAFNLQMLVHSLEGGLAQAGVEVPRPARPPAIAFLDLSGFTRLTDEAPGHGRRGGRGAQASSALGCGTSSARGRSRGIPSSAHI